MNRPFPKRLLPLLLLIGPALAGCSQGSGETVRAVAAESAAAPESGGAPVVRVSNGSPSASDTASADAGATNPAVSSGPGSDTAGARSAGMGDPSVAAGSVAAGAAARAGAGSAETEAPAGQAAAASTEPGLRILVSIAKRRLWLVDGRDTLMRAAVAIGMGKDFSYEGRTYHFATPKGTRKVLAKAKDPVWIVPEWHYYEKAAALGLGEVVRLEDDASIVLADSSVLTIRDGQVGRVNHFGYFAPFTPGTEIVFDGRMYIPPVSTAQRKVPNALGPYKLDMGDGYLIHGTHLYNEESIGDAVSHGCVRMTNEDLTRLYPLVPRGTPVIIF